MTRCAVGGVLWFKVTREQFELAGTETDETMQHTSLKCAGSDATGAKVTLSLGMVFADNLRRGGLWQ